MCGTCGCSGGDDVTVIKMESGADTASNTKLHAHHGHDHSHSHEDKHAHDHNHHHAHDSHKSVVSLERAILEKNREIAERNRSWFSGREILALNLVSSPGSGKTTLIEKTIKQLKERSNIFVIDADQATTNDAERIRATGVPVVQINTGTGCHLEADMVARGLRELAPDFRSIVIIENIGNLVCPAMFDLGEYAKIAIISVTEGEDKPLKYPHMFQASGVVLINKTDLLPHLDFSLDECIRNIKTVNSKAKVLCLSARTGEGMEAWCEWILEHTGEMLTAV